MDTDCQYITIGTTPACFARTQPLMHSFRAWVWRRREDIILFDDARWRLLDGALNLSDPTECLTCYGLDGPRTESPWGARFFAPVQTGPGAQPASCTMGTGSFPVVNRPRRGVDHPPSYSAEVKEKVELYLYSPSGPSWPVLGWTLPLSLPNITWDEQCAC